MPTDPVGGLRDAAGVQQIEKLPHRTWPVLKFRRLLNQGLGREARAILVGRAQKLVQAGVTGARSPRKGQRVQRLVRRVSERARSTLRGVAAFVAITAAVVFAVFAWALYEIACDENCVSPRPVRTWQLVVAAAAIAPVIGGARFLLLRRTSTALGFFAVALCLYAGWAVILLTAG